MDLVTQAYLKMHANPAKEAASVLSGGKHVPFHPINGYEITHEHPDSESSAMANLTDRLESNGFTHMEQDQKTNTFQHNETGKKIVILTHKKTPETVTHFIKRDRAT